MHPSSSCLRSKLATPSRGWLPALAGALLALAGCAHRGETPGPQPALSAVVEAAPVASACPASLPAGVRCLSGQDSAGAYYVIALPAQWNGSLLLHAHGGPALGAPKMARTVEDLERWAVMLREGYAWAGSSFRQGGVAVRSAAQDTERLRRIFVQHVAQPTFTILHGQSWGGGVAAIGASMFVDDGAGRKPYDAVLLTSGLLSGGSRAYEFRLDLRVIYQALCGNHPRPDEADYPLWMGLPAGATLSADGLRQRVDNCLALDQPAARRTTEQQRKVDTIVAVLKIPASSIHSHLAWGTFHFQDIVQRRTGGRNPFSNIGAQYRGSDDDEALNRAVMRYSADPLAAALFAADTDLDGRLAVPVLTVHGIGDPTVFVEVDHLFQQTLTQAGTGGHLVQTFTTDATHSYLTDAAYRTLLATLSTWAKGGEKPTPAQIASNCLALVPAPGPACRFKPDFYPQPLQTRVTPREAVAR